jgi:hypothetical protein
MRFQPTFFLVLALAGAAWAAEPLDGAKPQDAIITSLPGGPPRHIELKHDRIWSGVVLATDVPAPKEPPPELQEFASRLKRVFGYNQLELVGSATEVIDELSESWLVPSPLFPLSVKARHAPSKEAHGGYLLNLRLFQQDRPLVDTEAKLGPGSPLFIRGPLYGKGQIILVLQVQH